MTETSGSKPPGGSAAWATWVAFAGIMLVLIGVFSVIAGLAATFDDGYITKSTGNGEIFLLDVTTLGIAWIILGVIKAWAGWALIMGREWARFVTIFLVCLHVIIDLLTITSQPFLSLVFIVVDLVILYAVTVRWDEAKVGMGD